MTFHEILNIILFNRKIILQITVVTMIFLYLILFFIYPITYSSEIKILPPEENKISGISNLVGNTDFLSLLGNGSLGGNSQLFAEILKSRSAAEYVVEKCNLIKHFDVESKQVAAEKLRKIIDVEVNKEGIIILTSEATTPFFSRFSKANDSTKILSAKISNTFAEALDKINREKLNSRAKRSREYIERQIEQTKISLDSSEITLKRFQEKNKAISLPEQLTASIQTAAKLKSEIILTEIQLGTLSYNAADEKILEGLNRKLEEQKKQYSNIEGGEKLNSDYMPAFKDVPELSLELARLYREVKIQNEVYLLLQKQFFTEKIQENKDIPTVEVLDKAIPPLKPKSPRLVFHTIVGGVIAFLLSSLVLLYIEKKNKVLKKS